MIDRESIHPRAGGVNDAGPILDHLRHSADLLSVALLHETGVVLAREGDERFLDQGEIGALAAGAFSATAMLADRLGDGSAAGLCHEGHRQSFLILPVDQQHLLLAVFPAACKLGVVRLCLQRAAAALRGEAVSEESRPPDSSATRDWLEA